MKQFMVDVETLSTKDDAVVLSAAITWFDAADTDVTYEDLVARSLYVKFDAKEQIDKYQRKVSSDTLQWWSQQSESIRKLCFKPSPKDSSAVEGIEKIRAYIKSVNPNETLFWARGSLDSRVLEFLCSAVGVAPIARYNQWMDVRTAIRLLKETTNAAGYCPIPDFDDSVIMKHNPLDDIALDVLMLVRGV